MGAVRGKRHWPAPAQVRETLEELGVVFLKFGQVLALRRDLLADAYVAELERLHDRLPPMDFVAVQATVERELGGSLEQLFASFDPMPLAAATIAQVHAASLIDGRPVVVKVRRTGLDRRIAQDIATLTYLAALAERFAPRLATLDLVGMVREFRDSLLRETDFRLDQAIRYYRGRGGPDRWLMTNVLLAAVTCVVTRRILGRLLPRLLPDMPREVAEDLVQHTWLSSTSTIWEGVYRHDVARDADRLPTELPVLCLHGDRDVTAPLEYVRRLAEGRSQWTLRVLPDVDHHPLLRDPARCLAAIREFAAPSKHVMALSE